MFRCDFGVESDVDFAQGEVDLVVNVFQIRLDQELILIVLVSKLVDDSFLVTNGDWELRRVEVEQCFFFEVLQLAQEKQLVDFATNMLILV